LLVLGSKVLVAADGGGMMVASLNASSLLSFTVFWVSFRWLFFATRQNDSEAHSTMPQAEVKSKHRHSQ
jgi:hypothetical protein